jgi:ABC-type cobalamin/Fe3+-siderophores transport system ATPase subunit
VATHHTELAAAIADHAVVLSDGAVVAAGPPQVALAAVQ